jgi:hypothetical protein
VDQARARGARVILDYTDHHLGFPSEMGDSFYRPVLSKVDCCITSSSQLRASLSKDFSGEIQVIADPIEVPIVPPKKVEKIRTVLWFGHPSNVGFLLRWLNSLTDASSFELIALTDAIGYRMLRSQALSTRADISINVREWSVENMVAAAELADFCVIPSDILDPRKSGASSNRLLTALALGLPTAATMIPSYREFSEYFLDLDLISPALDYRELVSLMHSVANAQIELLPNYSMQSIGPRWVDLLGARG